MYLLISYHPPIKLFLLILEKSSWMHLSLIAAEWNCCVHLNWEATLSMGINRAPALGVPYGDLPWGPSHFSLSLAVSICLSWWCIIPHSWFTGSSGSICRGVFLSLVMEDTEGTDGMGETLRLWVLGSLGHEWIGQLTLEANSITLFSSGGWCDSQRCKWLQEHTVYKSSLNRAFSKKCI